MKKIFVAVAFVLGLSASAVVAGTNGVAGNGGRGFVLADDTVTTDTTVEKTVEFALAEDTVTTDSTGKEGALACYDTDPVPVEVKDLPQAVVEALNQKYTECTIKEAFFTEGEAGKVYKVVLQTKEQEELTVQLNEKGEIQ